MHSSLMRSWNIAVDDTSWLRQPRSKHVLTPWRQPMCQLLKHCVRDVVFGHSADE